MNNIKNIFLSIVAISAIGILFLMVFYFENRLEDSSYELLRNSLFIGIPTIIVGYVIYGKLGDSIQQSVLNSSLFIKLYKQSKQESKNENFIFDYMNGKCFNCKNNKLSPVVDENIKAGTVLKCLECHSLNKKTIPDKLAISPLFIAGGSIFLFEKFNQYESKIMLGALIFSLVLGMLLAKFWVNKKLEE